MIFSLRCLIGRFPQSDLAVCGPGAAPKSFNPGIKSYDARINSYRAAGKSYGEAGTLNGVTGELDGEMGYSGGAGGVADVLFGDYNQPESSRAPAAKAVTGWRWRASWRWIVAVFFFDLK